MKKYFSQEAGVILGSLLFTILIAVSVVSAPIKSQVIGDLPDFQTVFPKLYQATLKQCSLEQLQSIYDKMTETQRAAVISYLGAEQWDKIVSGLEAPKKNFLNEKYKPLLGKATAADFQKEFPKILAANSTVMNPQQVGATLDALTEKEMGAMTIYLDNPGLKTMFPAIPVDRHGVILDHTPDWVLLEMGLRQYARLKDYTCTLQKQERVDGKLQDIEIIEMKYREKPKAIYMKWVDGLFKGREMLYNETVSNKDIRVRDVGAKGLIPVTIAYTNFLAKSGTNHLAVEVGFKFLLDLELKEWLKANKVGEASDKNFGIQKIGPDNVYVRDTMMKKNTATKYYAYRTKNYIDYTRSLLLKAEVYDTNDQLYEKYIYLNVKLNPGLKDIDFDQKNPAYRL